MPADIACEISRLTTPRQLQLAGMIASAVAVSPRSGIRVPSTLIALPGRRLAVWLAPLGGAPVAACDPDDGLAGLAGVDPPAGRPVCRPPRETGIPAPEKDGLALNIVSTMPAIIVRTRHPAMSGTTIPLRRIGAR